MKPKDLMFTYKIKNASIVKKERKTKTTTLFSNEQWFTSTRPEKQFHDEKKHTAEQNNGFCFVFLFLQCCCSLKLLLFGIAHDV